MSEEILVKLALSTGLAMIGYISYAMIHAYYHFEPDPKPTRKEKNNESK